MTETVKPKVTGEVLGELRRAAGEENLLTKPEILGKLSKDFYWYSPILKKELEEKEAEAIIRIRGMAFLKEVVSILVRNRLPITIRGGGTGNYGQSIPLYGGILLDLTGMNRIISIADGVVRAEAGTRLGVIEMQAREKGWELRCMPSTWMKSSLAGFLCGGTGGIGSISWGGINFRDNMKSMTLLTIEEDPRLVKFEERDCMTALHTYGTTGILVEAEMRLAPRVSWEQLIFVSRDWDRLTEWTDRIARDRSIRKRLVTQFQWPIPHFFIPLRKFMPADHHGTFLIVEAEEAEAVRADAQRNRIRHTHSIPPREPPRPPSITDYSWNHATLWAIKKDSSLTYNQIGFTDAFKAEIDMLWKRFPGEVFMHMEWLRGNPRAQTSLEEIRVIALPIVKYISDERLEEFSNFCREKGIRVSDPHSWKLETGNLHPDLAEKWKLKEETDPLGILNPGKMHSYRHNPFSG